MKLWVAHPDLLLSRIVLCTDSVTLVYRPSTRTAASSRQKVEISATTEEAWVDYDTLYFMQQIEQ
jgi:hypothetical protein